MSEELEILEKHLKNRSRRFKTLANFSLYVIAGIIIIGISFYYYGGKFVISKSLNLKKEKVEILNHVTERKLKEIISEVNEQNMSKERYYKILNKFRNDSREISRSVSDIEKNQLLILILAIGGTISLIFIQAYLIHIMEGVYLYYLTLGTYFKQRADSAIYAGKTIVQKEETLAKLLAPENSSFKASLKKQAP